MSAIPNITIPVRLDLFSSLLSFLSVQGLKDLQAAIEVELRKREDGTCPCGGYPTGDGHEKER